jgi:hypothetical protein
MFKSYKSRPFVYRPGEKIQKGSMVVLVHKGYQYKPGMVMEIVKKSRRKIMVTAVFDDARNKNGGFDHVTRPIGQFSLVRRDNFGEWLFRQITGIFTSRYKLKKNG